MRRLSYPVAAAAAVLALAGQSLPAQDGDMIVRVAGPAAECCGLPPQDPEKIAAARSAATSWLALIDSGEWERAWERGGAALRNNKRMSQKTWMTYLPKEREPFGHFVAREADKVSYKHSIGRLPKGDYVSIWYISKFEERGGVKENVIVALEPDDRWRVIGYAIFR